MFSHSEILFSAFFNVRDSKLKWVSYLHSKGMVYRLVVVIIVVLVFFQMKYFVLWLKQMTNSVLDNILLKLMYTI